MDVSNYEVLIADGHSLCRDGLANLLRTTLGTGTIHQVHDFATAMTALASCPAIGLASFDLDLPGMRHSEGLHELRRRFPKLRVVAVSATVNRRMVLDILASGVHGCIPKDLPVGEITDAFRIVASGQIYVPTTVCELGSMVTQMAANDSSAHGAQLTDRQMEVLGLMAAGRLCIAEGTVKVHIAAAFKFLNVHNRVSAAAAMRSLSLRREPDLTYLPGLFDERTGARYRRRRDDQVPHRLPMA